MSDRLATIFVIATAFSTATVLAFAAVVAGLATALSFATVFTGASIFAVVTARRIRAGSLAVVGVSLRDAARHQSRDGRSDE